MALTPGTRLGAYEITGSLGAGGMGEVYRARDERLGRTVAIKVSAAEFSERFEHEARSVAALSHPNICQLYDVGPNYLVMEYVDGRPVGYTDSPRKLLDLAVQIADGMAAAHAAGLVHRDLKPDNILVTVDGRVKILDFGLAKRLLGSGDADGATRTIGLTDPGTTLGTVAYMSPEQARGDPNLGPQSDQFSLGLVLYEMAAGRRAFKRESSAETMAAIIREEAEPLPATMPAPLRWVIERLLSKDPADRYDSSRDLYRELRQIRERLSQTTSASQAAALRPARRRALWGLGLVLAGVAAGVAVAFVVSRRPTSGGPDLSRYRFTPISLDTPTEREPAWSPDGKSLAYIASINGVQQVMTRSIGSAQAAQLTQRTRNAQRPFWSPDGSTIYFQGAAESGEVRPWLFSVSAAGGAAEPVIQGVTSAAIHPDGKTFAFSKAGKLWIGRDPRTDNTPPREFGKAPFEPPGAVEGFSPDGSKLVVKGVDIWVIDYPSGEARRMTTSASGGTSVAIGTSWLPDSRRLVVGANTVAGAFSLSIVDTRTESRRVILSGPSAMLYPAVSPDGHRMAFVTGTVSWDVVEVQVSSGRVRTMPSAGGVSWWPAWAPSGTHYAFVSQLELRPAIRDMSAADDAGGFSRVLTEVETGALNRIRWAPDGNRFSFRWSQPSKDALMLENTSGGRALRVDEAAESSSDGIWSPDGQWLAYERRVGSELQLAKIRPGSRGDPQVLRTWPLGSTAGLARVPVDWSPDGRWILAQRTAPGLFLISPDGKTERQLSSSRGAGRPTFGFSRDGRAVLYLERNTTGAGAPWRLWSIDVATGVERPLVDVPLPPTAGDAAGFSLHPDGTRFLTSIANWPFDLWMLEGFEQ